jgi:hypothetical protein
MHKHTHMRTRIHKHTHTHTHMHTHKHKHTHAHTHTYTHMHTHTHTRIHMRRHTHEDRRQFWPAYERPYDGNKKPPSVPTSPTPRISTLRNITYLNASSHITYAHIPSTLRHISYLFSFDCGRERERGSGRGPGYLIRLDFGGPLEVCDRFLVQLTFHVPVFWIFSCLPKRLKSKWSAHVCDVCVCFWLYVCACVCVCVRVCVRGGGWFMSGQPREKR